jgi:hypothetical protein
MIEKETDSAGGAEVKMQKSTFQLFVYVLCMEVDVSLIMRLRLIVH